MGWPGVTTSNLPLSLLGHHGDRLQVHDKIVVEIQDFLVGLLGLILRGVPQNKQS